METLDKTGPAYKMLEEAGYKVDKGENLDEASGYKDSAEATDVIYDLNQRLNDKKLLAWAKVTDSNLGANTVPLLRKAIKAYDLFVNEMDSAGE